MTNIKRRLALGISVALLAGGVSPLAYSNSNLDKYDDRALHFSVSTGLGAAAYWLSEDKTISYTACLGVGLGKELYDDAESGNSFSGKDIVFDIIGCSLGIEASALVEGLSITPSYDGNEASLSATYNF